MHLRAYEMPEALKQEAHNNAAECSLTEFLRTRKKDGLSGGALLTLFRSQFSRRGSTFRDNGAGGLALGHPDRSPSTRPRLR